MFSQLQKDIRMNFVQELFLRQPSAVQMKQKKQRQPLKGCFRPVQYHLALLQKISMINIFKYVHKYCHVNIDILYM